MGKLYYGNGDCSINGADVRGIAIKFSGMILIEDNTSDSFIINCKDNKIIIFPVGEGSLSELFKYKGYFQINRILAVDSNAEKIPITIQKVMDYSELVTTNAEDMTTKSEDMNVGYISEYKVNKTRVIDDIERNLHTDETDITYYINGDEYRGYYHKHRDGATMTGVIHTKDSKVLGLK